jgi:hypothetical protein
MNRSVLLAMMPRKSIVHSNANDCRTVPTKPEASQWSGRNCRWLTCHFILDLLHDFRQSLSSALRPVKTPPPTRTPTVVRVMNEMTEMNG